MKPFAAGNPSAAARDAMNIEQFAQPSDRIFAEMMKRMNNQAQGAFTADNNRRNADNSRNATG